ncbi:MAG TPA: type II toxin-antitoxin system VapC family toxin [Caulobacter sp.]|nr:type II toxin-antitoxin system VapC family toxin [Caulobacter sp.]
MNAIDTSLLVRFLLEDDADQHARAVTIVDAGAWVSSTVALELEWVLRGYYGFTPERIAIVFDVLLRLRSLSFEHPVRVETALRGLAAGLDFADAFHLASAEGQDGFATFDRTLVRRAARLPGVRAFEP